MSAKTASKIVSHRSGFIGIEIALLVLVAAGIFAAAALVRENQNLEKQAALIGVSCNTGDCIKDCICQGNGVGECNFICANQKPTVTAVPHASPTKFPTSKPRDPGIPPTKAPTSGPTQIFTRPALPTVGPGKTILKPSLTPTPLPVLFRLIKFWIPDFILNPVDTPSPERRKVPFQQSTITPKITLLPVPNITVSCIPRETTCTRGGYATCEEQRGQSGYWRCNDAGSGWDCVSCPEGWICPKGRGSCTFPTPTPRVRCIANAKSCRGEEFNGSYACGDDQLGICKPDGSGYECLTCRHVCPLGKGECLPPSPTPFVQCLPNSSVCRGIEIDKDQRCYDDELGICRADGSGYDCLPCPLSPSNMYECKMGSDRCTVIPTPIISCTPGEFTCAPDYYGFEQCNIGDLAKCREDGKGWDCTPCPYKQPICDFSLNKCVEASPMPSPTITVQPPTGLNALTAEQPQTENRLAKVPILGWILKFLGVLR